MIPVVPPLQRGDHGPAVTNLTDVLALLVDRGAIRALTDPNRPTAAELSGLVVKVRSEGAQAEFGDATRQLVRYFQLQHRLGDTLGGLVETTTADSLNATLTTLGVLTSLPDGAVSGRIYSADRPGVDALRVQLVAAWREHGVMRGVPRRAQKRRSVARAPGSLARRARRVRRGRKSRLTRTSSPVPSSARGGSRRAGRRR